MASFIQLSYICGITTVQIVNPAAEATTAVRMPARAVNLPGAQVFPG